MHKGEVKVARFAFTNVSQRVVTVAEVQTGGDYLEMTTQQKEFKPGEAGTLSSSWIRPAELQRRAGTNPNGSVEDRARARIHSTDHCRPPRSWLRTGPGALVLLR